MSKKRLKGLDVEREKEKKKEKKKEDESYLRLLLARLMVGEFGMINLFWVGVGLKYSMRLTPTTI